MRTSAPMVADLSTTAVGWISVTRGTRIVDRLTGELRERALERAYPPQQLGEAALGRHDSLRLEHRSRWGAEVLATGFDVGRHAGLGADERAVADGDMVGHADLASQDDAASQPRGAGDADLRDEDRVLTDLDVVADLHEV